MRKLVEDAGASTRIIVDSAGTAAYHAGEPPDRRSAAAARRRGITLAGRARQFEDGDWRSFHYVVAMDTENHRTLARRAPDSEAQGRLHLLRDFDREAPKGSSVPDPYYGEDDGFELVLDLCDAACRGLLSRIRRTHGVP